MTPYKLHAINDWASLIIHLALEELGVPYQIVPHDWDSGTLDGPAFRQLNPRGLLPVLETPEGPIFETGAILLWLAETHGALAPQAGSADRARFLSWFLFVANTLHPTAMHLIHPYRPGGEDVAGAVGAVAKQNISGQFALLEELAVTKPAWLSPSAPSILSLYVLVMLRWSTAFAADPDHNVSLASFPHLKAIALGHEARPAIQRAATAEGLGLTPFSAPEA